MKSALFSKPKRFTKLENYKFSNPCEIKVAGCPLLPYLDVISKKWSLQLLRLLAMGESRRFNELTEQVKGITPRILSQRLAELEKRGLVLKKKFNEVPPRVEYYLTEKGRELLPCYAPNATVIIRQTEAY